MSATQFGLPLRGSRLATRMRARALRRIASCAAKAVAGIALAAASAACGSDDPELPPLAPAERAQLEAAYGRALADSATMAGASFSVPVSLETRIEEDSASVTVRDRFRLTKRPGGEFVTQARAQEVVGERELLRNMYSFEDAGGELRSETEARFTSVGFGADERRILDDLLDGRIGLEGPIAEALSADGDSIRIVHFAAEDMRGTLEIDRATHAARRVTMRRTNSSLIGGYLYTMTLELSSPSARLRLPVAMRTEFSYDRIGTSGTGIVLMRIDTTGLQTGGAGRAVQ